MVEPKVNPRSHLWAVVLCYPWVCWKIWRLLRYRAPGRGAVHASKQDARCPCIVFFIVSCNGALSSVADAPSSPVHYVFLFYCPWLFYLLPLGAIDHLRDFFLAVAPRLLYFVACGFHRWRVAHCLLFLCLLRHRGPYRNSWFVFGEAFY